KSQRRLQKKNHRGEDGSDENPVERGDAKRPLIEAPAHVQPEISFQFGVTSARDRRAQQFFHSIVVHGSIPILCSFFRRIRTARKTRDFTPLTEIPRAAAISSYCCSSMRARVAAARSFAGNSRKARAIFSRVSRLTAGSAAGSADGSTSSATSGRWRFNASMARLQAMRRAHAEKLPVGMTRAR